MEYTMVFALIYHLSLVSAADCACINGTSALPIVDLGYQLQWASGFNSTDRYYNFSNIRYAAPPLGDLRFAAPQTPQRNRAAVQSGQDARVCPQAYPAWDSIATEFVPAYLLGQRKFTDSSFAPPNYIIPTPDPKTSEDCLFLDVFVPEHIWKQRNSGTQFPVLFWIFGGGYVEGSKTLYGSPRGLLARGNDDSNKPGVIYVSINYRLGAFGWLSGPTFEHDGGLPNAGLYDQRFALQWVQRYIHLFGGDRDQVTVFGQSAGGGSIVHQITAFGGAQGPAPFRRAIPQSPAFQINVSPHEQETIFQNFLKSANVASLAEARAMDSSQLQLANIITTLASPYGTFTYGPVVDGVFTPLTPGQLLSRGHFDKSVSIMVGQNQDEGLLFASPFLINDVDDTVLQDTILTSVPTLRGLPDQLEYIISTLYPPIYDGSQAQGYKDPVARGAALASEFALICNAYYFDKAYNNRTYAYIFDVFPAIHGQDASYTYYEGNEAPAVKVTTVKMLAQILHGALFIDRASSCNILIGLLVHAKHIDIQHAITDSLLSTLGESTSTVEARTQILDALEAHVVPVAGRLSERYPMTEAAWATAAAPSNPVPDIGKDSSLLTLLNYFAKTSRLKEQEKTRLVHLILGTQEQSAANNARWMTLFLEKNGFSLECNEIQSELPIGPVNLDLFVKLAFDWTPYMTLSSLEKLKRLVLLNLEPPPAIVEINEAVRKNQDLVRSEAGQHWLSQFGNSVAGALNHGMYQCIDILARRTAQLETQVRDGITVETMQEFVLDVARVLIRNDKVELLENLVTKYLAPSWESGGNYLARWKITTLPLLQQLVRTIEEYRTGKWQSNPKRTPTALPDSMQLRARMLPLPYGSRDEPASDDDINAFATELSQLIEETTATGRPYHKAWQTLKEVVDDRPRKVEFARFAMGIGGLDGIDLTKPSLADHLRIELAGYFLTKSGACQGGTEHLPTDRLVARWRGCEVEEFRLVGNSVAGKARGAGR